MWTRRYWCCPEYLALADGARGNFMYMRADVTNMKLGRLAIDLIAADAVTALLLFWCRSQMFRDKLTPLSAGTRIQPNERKQPTTTQTKRGQHPAASASPGALGSSHYGHVFVEEWQAMQIAPSAVFPLRLLFSLVVCAVSEDRGELGVERVP